MKKIAVGLSLTLALFWGCNSGGVGGDGQALIEDDTPPLGLELPTPERRFFVSPNGNDANDGSEQAPFLTLERARDAVRALPATEWDKDVSVNLLDGTYRLARTLVLEPRDSGQNGHVVIYRAAPGAHPVLTGAVPVTGWQLSDPAKGIFSATVGKRQTRQLYVNGRRAVRARTDDYPAGFLPAFYSSATNPQPLGIEYIPTTLNPADYRDPSTWTNPSEVEAVIVTQWKQMNVPVASVIPFPNHTVDKSIQPLFKDIPLEVKTGLIKMQEPGWTNANEFLDKDTRQPGLWSFWQVTWFENAYEFLDLPGEWYLNEANGTLYYRPRQGENMQTAEVELPVLETLIEARGEPGKPVSNLRFEGLTFTGATWLQPSTSNGYVADQSAFHVVGTHHQPNVWGHDQFVERTPGNVSFNFASDITLYGNVFEHLGGVGLDFVQGCQRVTVDQNSFRDISSSAIVLGGVETEDARPPTSDYATVGNTISGNLVRNVGVDYRDAAGIFVGFTADTTLVENTIAEVPWSGIAMGWGWGLLDEGMFPGNPGSIRGEWGTFTDPTINSGNRILRNRFYAWGNVLWDTGAIYTTGQQGQSADDPLLIEGNVATNKRPSAGSNIYYTDGGSRYIVLKDNVSADNPVGDSWFGPAPRLGDPLPHPEYYKLNCFPYGFNIGGCIAYGDIVYDGNFGELWFNTPLAFYNPCPFTEGGVTYPTNLQFNNNHVITRLSDVPAELIAKAGVQSQPPTIPADRWVLPPSGEPGEKTVVDCPQLKAKDFCSDPSKLVDLDKVLRAVRQAE